MLKSSGSRLIQACFKHGNQDSKELLFLKIMKKNPHAIFRNEFGKFVVKKIMQSIRNKELLEIMRKCMSTNFAELFGSDNGQFALSEYIEQLPDYQGLEFLAAHARHLQEAEAEELGDKITAYIEKKKYLGCVQQYWLYTNWAALADDRRRQVLEQLRENLEPLMGTNIAGILLYCRIFDSIELKEKTKLIKKCLAKKLVDLLKLNPNILFLLVKITNSYDDSGNIATIVYNEVIANFNFFVENQQAVTYLFYVLCEDFEKELGSKFHPKYELSY